MASLTGLHHVALSVRDLDSSVAWYQDLLGLVVEGRMDDAEHPAVILGIPGSAQQLGLVGHATPGAAFAPQNLGLDHAAFAVESGEALQEWAATLEERGVPSSGVIETPFGGMLNFADPDGIALALFWNR